MLTIPIPCPFRISLSIYCQKSEITDVFTAGVQSISSYAPTPDQENSLHSPLGTYHLNRFLLEPNPLTVTLQFHKVSKELTVSRHRDRADKAIAYFETSRVKS